MKSGDSSFDCSLRPCLFAHTLVCFPCWNAARPRCLALDWRMGGCTQSLACIDGGAHARASGVSPLLPFSGSLEGALSHAQSASCRSLPRTDPGPHAQPFGAAWSRPVTFAGGHLTVAHKTLKSSENTLFLPVFRTNGRSLPTADGHSRRQRNRSLVKQSVAANAVAALS